MSTETSRKALSSCSLSRDLHFDIDPSDRSHSSGEGGDVVAVPTGDSGGSPRDLGCVDLCRPMQAPQLWSKQRAYRISKRRVISFARR